MVRVFRVFPFDLIHRTRKQEVTPTMNKVMAIIGQADTVRAYQRTDYVWSKLRHIYHTAGCRWEARILDENRQHGSLRRVQADRPRRGCHVCWP